MLSNLDNHIGFFKEQHLQFCKTLTSSDIVDFTSLKSDEERFAFVFNCPFIRSNQISLRNKSKSIDSAKHLKEIGNKAFAARDYLNARVNYSKAVLNCPHHDNQSLQELSVIFANRSATFYHTGEYEKSLRDIENCLQLNYPQHLCYKVHDRKARCLLALKQHKSAVEAFRRTLTTLDDSKLPLDNRHKCQKDIQIMLAMLSQNPSLRNETKKQLGHSLPKVDGKRNKHYPAMIDAISFKYSDKSGRYAEANQTIKAGDVILVEKPHCAVLIGELAQTHCFQCFTKLDTSYPCPECSNIAFCSKQCQVLAVSTHHKAECPFLQIVWSSGASITCHMALRIFTQKNLKYFLDLKPFLQQRDTLLEVKNFDYDDYRSVYYLERNESKRTTEDFLHRTHMAVFLFQCLKKAGYFAESVSDDLINGNMHDRLTNDELYVGGLLLHNLQFLQFNAHEVSELEVKNGEYDKGTSIFLGGAIYPTLSMFNHSCNPALVRYFQGATVIGRAIRATLKGEMVAENYGPTFMDTRKNQRQETLQTQYWFSCECVACTENWPLIEEMNDNKIRFRCLTPDCNTPILVPVDTMKFMALCPNCKEHTNLFKGLKALQDTDSMFRVARSFMREGDIEHALPKLLELLQMLDEILAPPFKDFHLCQQATRTCMLSLGNCTQEYIK